MISSFAGRARVASGTGPSRTVAPYRVQVAAGSLALVLDLTGCPVLQAGLERVTARPLGRAGGVVVTVDGAPLWVDFTDRDHGAGTTRVVRRVRHGLHGRRVRRAFLAATEAGR